MKDVSKGQGRTVLFVSHNMIAVEWLYNNAILLSNGTIAMNSKSNEVLNYYTKNNNTILTTEFNGEYFNYSQDKIRIINAKVNKNTTLNSFLITESFNITIEINVLKQVTLNTTFIIFSSDDQHVCSTSSINKNGTIHSFTPGIHQIVCNVPSDFFNCGIYKFTLIIVENYTTVLIVIENIFILDFKENIETRGHYLGPWNGFVRPKWSWNLSKN
jgi:lipopolysaccharide transport system ATP-binding protein